LTGHSRAVLERARVAPYISTWYPGSGLVAGSTSGTRKNMKTRGRQFESISKNRKKKREEKKKNRDVENET